MCRRLMVAGVLLALPACDTAGSDSAGAVSKGEAQALAEAAAMLDETRTLPDEAVPSLEARDNTAAAAQTPVNNAR